MVMNDIGQGVDHPMISPTFHPLFTNKLIGLKRVQRNRISQVNLVDYSWDRDDEGESPSEDSYPHYRDDQRDRDSQDHPKSSSSDSGSSHGGYNANYNGMVQSSNSKVESGGYQNHKHRTREKTLMQDRLILRKKRQKTTTKESFMIPGWGAKQSRTSKRKARLSNLVESKRWCTRGYKECFVSIPLTKSPDERNPQRNPGITPLNHLINHTPVSYQNAPTFQTPSWPEHKVTSVIHCIGKQTKHRSAAIYAQLVPQLTFLMAIDYSLLYHSSKNGTGVNSTSTLHYLSKFSRKSGNIPFLSSEIIPSWSPTSHHPRYSH